MISLDTLPPGQRVVYFTGPSLARARQGAPVEAAAAAWEAAMRGEVDLAQRRRPDGGLDYIAIGRHRIDKSPVKPVLTVVYHPRKAA